MSHAEKCPVCNGSGKISDPLNPDLTSANPIPRNCHGCMGLGWVTIQENRIMPTYIEPRAKDKFHKHAKGIHHGEGSD